MSGEVPSSPATTRISARSSRLDSIKGCGLSGMRIDIEDLKRRVRMPDYLREAMARAIANKDPEARPAETPALAPETPAPAPETPAPAPETPAPAPETPVVVFVNSKSGGRHGPVLKGWLEQVLGRGQVFELSNVKPSQFVQYGLACLENLGNLGDNCAKFCREKLRIIVAGGDGTVGWVLGSLGELYLQNREPVPPTAIIPLGTGNDLARSFGWGGSFPYIWRSAMKKTLHKAITGRICRLDSWQVVVSMPSGETLKLPHSLKEMEESSLVQDGYGYLDGNLPEKISCFGGVFYNYFSIGMDAQVAYGFHHLRNEKPFLARGPISNKLIYSGYSCTQGWFCTPCSSDPGLRGLKNILRLFVKKINCSEWEQIPVPSGIRAVVVLNLHNYGGGRHPWGQPKPEYLEKRGFVEAHVDDGLLEIVGLKQGWHASFVLVELISAKHIAQAAAIRFEIRDGRWKKAYMQMDGEPWKQPIKSDFSTFVDIKKVPHHSVMINGHS